MVLSLLQGRNYYLLLRLTTYVLRLTTYVLRLTTYHLPPTSYYRIPNTKYRIPNTEYRIPNAHCPLPTDYCPLTTDYCLPAITYYYSHCSKGGGRESNLKLVPYMVQMTFFLLDANAEVRRK